MCSIKHWISAARLRTLPLAFSSILTGAALAIGHGVFDRTVLILCLVTTLFLQILSNYANDLGDYLQGTDNEDRIGPERAVQGGHITALQMKVAVIVLAILSFTSGIALLYHSGLRLDIQGLFFLVLGLLAIAAAIKYTAGKNPYGYAGLGDISVFLFFGLIGVLGSFYLHGRELPQTLDVFAASAIGFFSTAVLNLNNMRDAVPDKAAAKNTMAVRLGRKNARIYHMLLISLGGLCLLIYCWRTAEQTLELLPLAVLVIMGMHLLSVSRAKEDRALDSELKKVALSTFLVSVLLVLSKTI